MKNTAIVKGNLDYVILVSKMQPAFWKRFLFALYPIAFIAIMIGVVNEGQNLESQNWLWIAFGVWLLFFLWPGVPLAWNVLGEEYFKLSTKAIQWGYNYRIVRTGPKTKQFNVLKTKYVEERVLEGVSYGCLHFYTDDENGFDQLLCATSIPIPFEDLEKFSGLVGEMFLEEGMGFQGAVVLDN